MCLQSQKRQSNGKITLSRDVIIDGWRGLSVVAVVLGHAIRFRFGPWIPNTKISELVTGEPSITSWLGYILHRFGEVSAATGVQIFFCISGYIITSLLLKEESEDKTISIRAFYVRRAFRILPAFLFYLAICWASCMAGAISIPGQAFLWAGTFTCNLSSAAPGWFLSHIWSLSVEEQFYVFWPLGFIFVPKASRVIVLGSALFILSGLTMCETSQRNTVSFACISVGALIACSPTLRSGVKKAAHGGWLSFVLASILFSINFSSYKLLFNVMQVLIPIGIGYIIFCSSDIPVMVAVLTALPLQIAGIGSYSLYLWQQLFLAWPAEYIIGPPPLLLLPISVILSYYGLERPFARTGRRFSERLKENQRLKTRLAQCNVS